MDGNELPDVEVPEQVAFLVVLESPIQTLAQVISWAFRTDITRTCYCTCQCLKV